jgi:hypothetical protein
VDSAVATGEELRGHAERVADAHSQIHMEIPREREMQQRRMRDAPSHASPSDEDIRDVVVRQDVVDPFARCTDRKCSNRNVVEAQD